jgi:hypothetical protein
MRGAKSINHRGTEDTEKTKASQILVTKLCLGTHVLRNSVSRLFSAQRNGVSKTARSQTEFGNEESSTVSSPVTSYPLRVQRRRVTGRVFCQRLGRHAFEYIL